MGFVRARYQIGSNEVIECNAKIIGLTPLTFEPFDTKNGLLNPPGTSPVPLLSPKLTSRFGNTPYRTDPFDAGTKGDKLREKAKGMLKLIKQATRLQEKVGQKGGAK